MQGNVNIPDSTITTNLSFRQLVLMNMQQLTNFPYIEKDFDALTDYALLCKVVDYDRLLELNDSQGIQLAVQRLRGLMFSPQAMGEHFMQNTMLFAMMKSHRLKTDDEGKVHIIEQLDAALPPIFVHQVINRYFPL